MPDPDESATAMESGRRTSYSGGGGSESRVKRYTGPGGQEAVDQGESETRRTTSAPDRVGNSGEPRYEPPDPRRPVPPSSAQFGTLTGPE